jgi:hypothetical protein
MLHLWELSNGGSFSAADEEGQRVDKEMRAVAPGQSTKYISFNNHDNYDHPRVLAAPTVLDFDAPDQPTAATFENGDLTSSFQPIPRELVQH